MLIWCLNESGFSTVREYKQGLRWEGTFYCLALIPLSCRKRVQGIWMRH